MLYMTLGGMYRAEGNLEKSIECYQKAHEFSSELISYQLLSNYELGHNYYLAGNWSKAIELFESYIFESNSPNFKAYGGYKLGVCYWMVDGENAIDKITDLYKKVINEWKRPNLSYDAYAARHCQKFISSGGYSKLEELFIKISNFQEGNLLEQASEILVDIEKLMQDYENSSKTISDNDKALYLYWKGHLYQKLDKRVDALKSFNSLIQMADKVKEDTWIIPYAELESVEIFIKNKDFAKAHMVIEMVKKRSNYDFEKHVSMRCKKLHSKIERHSNEHKK